MNLKTKKKLTLLKKSSNSSLYRGLETKNLLLLTLFFYILALFQISFFVHFGIFKIIPNLIFIFIIIINLFEKPQNFFGFFSAFIGGFFLDVFSEGFVGIDFFGFYILISMAIAIFIKFVLKKYVRIPFIQRS